MTDSELPTAAYVGGIDAVNPLTNTIVATTKIDLREDDELVRREDVAGIIDDELSMVRSVKDEHDKESPQFKNAEAHERKLHELIERFGVEDQLYADLEKKNGEVAD